MKPNIFISFANIIHCTSLLLMKDKVYCEFRNFSSSTNNGIDILAVRLKNVK